MRKDKISGFSALGLCLAAATLWLAAGEGQAADPQTTYLAHFVNARLEAGTQSTILVLSNPGDEAAQLTVRFVSSNGEPASVFVEGSDEPVEVLERNLAAGASTRIFTSSPDPVSGWIEVVAPDMVQATGILHAIVSQGGFRRVEAGIFAAPAATRANIPVERELAGFLPLPDLSTAVALANPSFETARVTLRLLDDGATELGRVELSLEPQTQQAKFIEELFPDIPLEQAGIDAPRRFAGSLQVSSDTAVALAALRTQGGLQLSSPPVAQLQQGLGLGF